MFSLASLHWFEYTIFLENTPFEETNLLSYCQISSILILLFKKIHLATFLPLFHYRMILLVATLAFTPNICKEKKPLIL